MLKNYKEEPLNTASNIRLLVCGPSTSGKTTLVKELLHKNFRGKFDDIFVICPSLQQELWKNIKFSGRKEKENKSDEPTDEQFLKYIDKIEKNLKEKKRSLLILDDVVNTELTKRTSELCKYWLRIRHMHCSVVLISQNLKGIPPFIRSNITHFISFHYPSKSEMQKMGQEYGDKFLEKFDEYTSEPYKYILCDFTKNELTDERYSNDIENLEL